MLKFLSRRERVRQHYEQAVRSHTADLYAFAFRLCGCRDVAEDLVQETFYYAWKGLDSLRRSEAIRAWLFQILRHRHARWQRDEITARAAINRGNAARHDGEDGESRTDPAIRLAERDSIQEALNALDDKYRIPILMVCIEGLTCRETAEQLDLPLGTVLSRLHRARAHMDQTLQREEREPRSQSGTTGKASPDHPSLRLGGGA